MIASYACRSDGYGRSPWKNGGGIFIDIADAYRDATRRRVTWDNALWRFRRTAITTPRQAILYLPDITRMQMVVEVIRLVSKAPGNRRF